MKLINLEITIKLLTSFHVGGDPGEDANTSYILRGSDGKSYYPGTAFKGKLRHYASQMQNGACRCTTTDKCAVCRLFGGEGNARGSLVFSDFHSPNNAMIDTRIGITIDRYRRVVEDNKLFTIESDATHELVGYITGSVNDDNDVDFISKSIKLIQYIGGNTSRGMGWVDGEIYVNEISTNQTDSFKPNLSKTSATCVKLKVTPLSPMLIGAHTTESNFRDTKCIIPGSVMRAAFARAICEQDSYNDEGDNGENYVAPVAGKTNFPNLRREFSNIKFSVFNSAIQPEPYLATMRKCKYVKTHSMVDLLSSIINNVSDVRCPDCGVRLEKIDTYEDFENAKNGTVRSTHSELDKHRGAARDERLYSIRAIAPKTIDNAIEFHGVLQGKIDIYELSNILLTPLYIGAMTTSGFGKCKVEIEPELEPVPEPELEPELETEPELELVPEPELESESESDPEPELDETHETKHANADNSICICANIIERVKKFNALINVNEFYIPATLLSDAIVDIDEPADGDFLKAHMHLFEPFDLKFAIAKHVYANGFDTSKTCEARKPAHMVIQAGSVFVLCVGELSEETINRLVDLETNGIGYETADGYGAIRIAHNSHIKYSYKTNGGIA